MVDREKQRNVQNAQHQFRSLTEISQNAMRATGAMRATSAHLSAAIFRCCRNQPMIEALLGRRSLQKPQTTTDVSSVSVGNMVLSGMRSLCRWPRQLHPAHAFLEKGHVERARGMLTWESNSCFLCVEYES